MPNIWPDVNVAEKGKKLNKSWKSEEFCWSHYFEGPKCVKRGDHQWHILNSTFFWWKHLAPKELQTVLDNQFLPTWSWLEVWCLIESVLQHIGLVPFKTKSNRSKWDSICQSQYFHLPGFIFWSVPSSFCVSHFHMHI